MNKMIFLGALAFGTVLGSAAQAQDFVPRHDGLIFISPVNCDYLHDYKAVCLVNQSDYSITGIYCAGALFHSNITLPNGRIPPASISIVEMRSGTCDKEIQVTYSNNEKKNFDHLDIKGMSVWTLAGPIDPDKVTKKKKSHEDD